MWREADGALDENVNSVHITIDDKYVKQGIYNRNVVRYRQSADTFFTKISGVHVKPPKDQTAQFTVLVSKNFLFHYIHI